MTSPVKPESSHRRKSSGERPKAADSTAPGHETPQRGIRHVADRPLQARRTVPRRDSDQLRKLGSRRVSDDHEHHVATSMRRASNEPLHPVGHSRRASDELNPRGVRSASGQRPQPQRSRSMPNLPDLWGRASYIDSHMRTSSASSVGTPAAQGPMYKASSSLAAAVSGIESSRRTSLPPAVVAAAAAALQCPLSARLTSQGSRTSSGATQKTSTVICYILVAVLGLTVSLAVLFSLLWSALDSGDTSELATCTTHACREYALRLIASINSSVDPCQSFTRFVCDGWRRRQLLGVQEEAFGAANNRIARIVGTIDVPPTGQNPLQRAAMLYKSCIAVLTTPTGELDAVKSTLRAAGVMWPHRPPPAERRDLLRMMFHCDYALGWSAVFRVDPWLYQNSTKAYVLTDSGFNFIVRKYHERSTAAHRMHYFTRLRNAFQDTDEQGAADVVTFKEMQELEDKMFGPLIEDFYKNSRRTATVPDDVVYRASANLSTKRWTEVMENEGVKLIGKVEFRTWNLPFFSTFVDLLARHGELDMYAYASWCTVQVAALFANGELILNYYGHPQRALILHGAFCLSRAYIAAGKVLLRNYAREVLPLMARSGAETIALNVQTAFLERLSSWADYNFNASPLWSWDNTSMSFSVFDPVPKVNYTDVVVGEMGESFLQNWRNAWMSRTHYRAIDIKIAITAIETLAFSADIEYRKGFILLPYVFSFPYYDMNAMPSINYGGFGAQVAFAVGQRFHSTYLSEDTGGVSFNTFLSCISNVSLTAERKDAASLFAEVVSLGALVDAYRNVSDGRRLIFLERLTGDQLLFIAICYAKCIGSYYVVDDTMCNLVLQNVPEFSDAFGCAPGTPMNPRQQCRLFDRSFTVKENRSKT